MPCVAHDLVAPGPVGTGRRAFGAVLGGGWIALVAASAMLGACNDTTSRDDLAGPRSTQALAKDEELADLDLGEDWARIGLDDWPTPPKDRAGSSAGLPAPASGAPGRQVAPTAASAGPQTVWAIVLDTSTGEGHEVVAATRQRELARMDGRFASAWVQTSPKGSMILFGRYAGADDPAAQRDLKWVKSLTMGGRSVFRSAMLSRVFLDGQGAQSPYSLLAVRKLYPEVNPLYTLQIAAYGAFGGALALPDAQRRAEAYAAQLRAERLEAYVHHDPDKQMSIVTVGLFGPDSIDPRTGIVSPDIEALMRRFKHNLVNGEIFNEPIDPQRPSRGTRPQTSRLVLVP